MVATHGNGWDLAPSLIELVNEVDAKYPKRDKAFDGSIGDAAHAARQSEHNPDHDSDPMPEGMVSAVDITKDSAAMAAFLLKELIGDSRVWYVIHDHFIYSRTHNWEKRPYDGPNAHEHHLHVSLRQTREAAFDKSPWFKTDKPAPKPKPEPKPVEIKTVKPVALEAGVRPGANHPQVKLLQSLLVKAGYGPIPHAVTNFYGNETAKAVVRFHEKNRRFSSSAHDPVIGPKGFIELQRQAAAKS